MPTLILPDPFMRCKDLFKLWKPKQQAYYFMKHALNVLQYRELACSELSPPIVVVLPDHTAMEKEEMEFIGRLGKRDALIHAGIIFGRKFEAFEELMEFAGRLDSADLVVSAVADEEHVLFDSEWKGSLKERIVRAVKSEHMKMLKTSNHGVAVVSAAASRLAISNEILIRARRLRGTPVIDAPTSWQYLVWKLEYDAHSVESEIDLSHLHVVKGLQSLADNEMEWLGRVPVQALIEVRKTGAISEIRSILGKGIAELTSANPTNFFRTADRIFDNFHAAFRDHKKNIDDLTAKKWKFAGSTIGSWLAVGSLAITAAGTGQPVWGIAAYAADQLLDPLKLKHIPKSIKALAEESRKVKQSPAGLLFKYAQDNS